MSASFKEKLNNYKLSEFNRLLAYSMIIGFICGVSFNGYFNDFIAPAKQTAGLLNYQQNHLFSIYSSNIFSINLDFLKFLYLIGVSDEFIFMILSGLSGVVSMLSITLIVYFITKDVLFSLVVPLLTYFTGIYAHGISYGIGLFSSGGLEIFSLCIPLIALGFFINNRQFLSGLICGILPIIHPVSGSFFLGAFLLHIFLDLKKFHANTKSQLKLFIVAFAIAICIDVLYIIEFLNTRISLIDLSFNTENIFKIYSDSYIKHWDVHRKTLNILSTGFFSVLSLIYLSIVQWKSSLNKKKQFFYAFIIILCIVAILLNLITLFEIDLRNYIWKFIPARLLGYGIYLFFPVFISVIFYNKKDLAYTLIIILVVISIFQFIVLKVVDLKYIFETILGNLRLFSLTSNIFTLLIERPENFILHAEKYFLNLIKYLNWFVVFIFLLIYSFLILWKKNIVNYEEFKLSYLVKTIFVIFLIMVADSMFIKSDIVISKVVSRDKVLEYCASDIMENKNILVSYSVENSFSNMLIVKCKSTIVMPYMLPHGHLIPYLPQIGTEVNEYVSEVNGYSFLDKKPRDFKLVEKITWESRSNSSWDYIGNKYNADYIIAPSTYILNLEVIERSKDLILYKIEKHD